MTSPDEKHLAELARLAHVTEEEEIDCDEMLDRVGGYVRAVGENELLDPRMLKVVQHLKVCPECREELDALLRAEGIDPDEFRPR